MKILFTGHNGFLGRELIPQLSAKFSIATYDGDLLNYAYLSEFVKQNSISKIIHAAAKVSNRWDIDTNNNLIQNLKMTINVTNLGLPMLTFCSGKVYGYQNTIDNAAEEDAGNRYPDDFYGQGKFIIRKLVEDNISVHMLRYFNVFGKHEDSRKFVKANILRYLNWEPMIIDQNIKYDFFYVEDSLPIIISWILGEDIPKETNLVYPNKLYLDDVCKAINKLDTHKVEVIVKQPSSGKNYFGNGRKFHELGYPLIGLEEGLRRVYQNISNRCPE